MQVNVFFLYIIFCMCLKVCLKEIIMTKIFGAGYKCDENDCK